MSNNYIVSEQNGGNHVRLLVWAILNEKLPSDNQRDMLRVS